MGHPHTLDVGLDVPREFIAVADAPDERGAEVVCSASLWTSRLPAATIGRDNYLCFKSAMFVRREVKDFAQRGALLPLRAASRRSVRLR
jgi:hypothetical protein